MAPNLSLSQHEQIRDMVLSNSLTGVQIAGVAGCSIRSIRTIRTNLRCFGTTKAPVNGVGRPKSITPPMLHALCDQLIEKPHMYQDEMVVFLWDEFEILVTTHSIGRALKGVGWSRKAARRVAQERNADLRDIYLHNLSEFSSYKAVAIASNSAQTINEQVHIIEKQPKQSQQAGPDSLGILDVVVTNKQVYTEVKLRPTLCTIPKQSFFRFSDTKSNGVSILFFG